MRAPTSSRRARHTGSLAAAAIRYAVAGAAFASAVGGGRDGRGASARFGLSSAFSSVKSFRSLRAAGAGSQRNVCVLCDKEDGRFEMSQCRRPTTPHNENFSARARRGDHHGGRDAPPHRACALTGLIHRVSPRRRQRRPADGFTPRAAAPSCSTSESLVYPQRARPSAGVLVALAMKTSATNGTQPSARASHVTVVLGAREGWPLRVLVQGYRLLSTNRLEIASLACARAAAAGAERVHRPATAPNASRLGFTAASATPLLPLAASGDGRSALAILISAVGARRSTRRSSAYDSST